MRLHREVAYTWVVREGKRSSWWLPFEFVIAFENVADGVEVRNRFPQSFAEGFLEGFRSVGVEKLDELLGAPPQRLSTLR